MDEESHDQYSRLKATAKDAPLAPGVYIMRDEGGTIIYVGKARVLRNRLSSYFTGHKDVKTRTLVSRARSIEFIITNNEYEALLLENTLIKQHTPKYNINLKDGKSYPVVRITAEKFPKVFRTRRVIEDGSQYFGPFPNVQAVDTLLDLIDKIFPLRKCRTLRKRSVPCMYYHIGRCSAPCALKIDEAGYAAHVEKARSLLSGDTARLTAELGSLMEKEAAALHFERAAQLRDAIRALADLSETRAVVDFDQEARDYIAWASEGILTTYTVFSMRGGKMTGRELFRARSAASEEESLQDFLLGYYSIDRLPPPRIFLAGGGEGRDLVQDWMRTVLDAQSSLLPANERRHEAVLAMAGQNAREDIVRRVRERGAGPALDELARVLGLRRRPVRIEGFDIAQLDGKYPVASLISFLEGVPDKKNYRHLRLKTVDGVVDDFQAMREAVSRRYSRLSSSEEELPDLVLVDGGIGQVNAAKGVLDALGIDVDIAGLAKRDEEIWRPGQAEPIRLQKGSDALRVLQAVRDETHRFATSFNQRLRSKTLSMESLEAVPGVGPAKASALIKAFGSLEALADASAEAIASAAKLPATTAALVVEASAVALAKRAEGRLRLAGGGTRKARQSMADLAATALKDDEEDGAGTAAETEPPSYGRSPPK